MREKIEDALLQMGISPSGKGFVFIVDAVELLANNDLCNGMGGTYEIIAEARETTYGAVERGIRYAIAKASRESDWWIKMGLSQRVTNGKFLSALALLIKRESQK